MSQTSNPAPKPVEWEPPTADAEYKFEGDISSAPAWIDKGWASYDRGPALAIPMGDLYGNGPYHTAPVRVGDTVKFIAATPSKAAHFVIIEGEPTGDNATVKIPQVSNASLEDALKGGTMTPDDLGPDAKAQVVARSPGLKKMIEEGKGAPDAVAVGDVVKVA